MDRRVLARSRVRLLDGGPAEFASTRRVSRGGQGLWSEHMSGMTRFLAGVGMVLELSLIRAGFTSLASNSDRGGAAFIPVGAVGVWFMVAVGLRPVIEARVTGMHVRNIMWEYWVPWEAIDTVLATMRVELILASGQHVTCWAVQKTNIAAMTHRHSRTDRVTEQLLQTQGEQLADLPAPTPAQITRRLARIPNRMVLAFCLYVLLAAVITRSA